MQIKDIYGGFLREVEGADLRRADLRGANLAEANLRRANLAGANLKGANLAGAELTEKDRTTLVATRTIVPGGDLIGWKKLSGPVICKLKIPREANRVGGVTGRKCRAEFAVVLEGSGCSQYEPDFLYEPGKKVVPDQWDDNPLVECSHGIHFFVTRQEAEDY